MAETQPQLHPALLSLSAMISQYFFERRYSVLQFINTANFLEPCLRAIRRIAFRLHFVTSQAHFGSVAPSERRLQIERILGEFNLMSGCGDILLFGPLLSVGCSDSHVHELWM